MDPEPITAGSHQVEHWLLLITIGTTCLLYTSDAADERSSVDLGGRRTIKKNTNKKKKKKQNSIHR